MQISYYDTLANFSSTSQETTKVVGDTVIQGQKYYVMFDSYALIYMINRNDGLYVLNFSNNQPILDLKYPGVVNDSYSNGTTNYSITSTDTVLSVPKGNLHCYQYSLTSTGTIIPVYHYYSPGVGVVQDEFAYSNRPIIGVRRKLVDYSLK